MKDRMPRRSSITSTHENKMVIHSQKPSFSQTMKEGVALGIGSSIGHRIVGWFMGPSYSESLIMRKQKEYEQCLKEHNDREICERIRF